MKILCIGYREWALNVYDTISLTLLDHSFKIIRSEEEYSDDIVYNFDPDLILWYGWSKIIQQNIIQKYFSVMLHPSPLPKYRGGSPIQNQIIAGETDSAVTLFKMDSKVDTGDIILQKKYSLKGDLYKILNRISNIGIELTLDMLYNFNNIKLTPQDNSKATHCKRIQPSQSEISIADIQNMSAQSLYNKIRSLQDPYPNAFITCADGRRLYITNSKI